MRALEAARALRRSDREVRSERLLAVRADDVAGRLFRCLGHSPRIAVAPYVYGLAL
jgi:hypothetical protein